MRKSTKKLEQIWVLSIVVIIIMLGMSNYVYRIWLGPEMNVSFRLSAIVALFLIINNISSIYVNLINGIGAIRVQLITYFVIATVSWPLMVMFSRYFGLVGVVCVPIIAVLILAVLAKIQLSKILGNRALGVWIK